MSHRGGIVVVGDALMDRDVEGHVERLAPDAPVPVVDDPVQRSRPGGAGLAATLAARAGEHRVTLVTALSADSAGSELAELLEAEGVALVDVGLAGPTPEKVRVRADGRTLLRLDRGGVSGRVGPAGEAALAAVSGAAAVLVSDYGRGVAAEPALRDAVAAAAAQVPVVWDPHPRGPEPVPGVTVVTPNEHEAGCEGEGTDASVERARTLRTRWHVRALCVTRGARGTLLVHGDGPARELLAPLVAGGDPCGAGDAFAAALTRALASPARLDLAAAAQAAVEGASAWVAAGGAAGFGGRVSAAPVAAAASRAHVVAAATRARGGILVASGGCFDLLHAGHVAMLQAARALGDALVVCVNSDRSVRALKGPDRPLVPRDDRVAVLEALGCVDAVLVFDEATPEAALAGLRPDVWAKGGDYLVAELPEARLLECWGGRAVILPYIAGRSTTRLIEEVALRAPA